MLVKEYTRLDWGGDRKFFIVIDNVAFFSPHWPKNSDKSDPTKTVVAFNNGTVMLLDVSLEQFRKTLATYKK